MSYPYGNYGSFPTNSGSGNSISFEKKRSSDINATDDNSTLTKKLKGDSSLAINLPKPDFKNLPPFEKHFYIEHPFISARSNEEVEKFRGQKEIHVSGEGVPKPFTSFEESCFPNYILDEIRAAGFREPTPIQSQAWPMILCGRDIVGLAETGSGKTLAYILPSIVHINSQPLLQSGDGPIVLVMAPTRELAVQIQQECARFGSSSRIQNTAVYGGVNKAPQIHDLRRGCEIVIATPGRLLDLLESRATNLKRVTYLVLDEADRMLDMGFEPQIRRIVEQTRLDRQTLLLSATWPEEVEKIAKEFLKAPVKVIVGAQTMKASQNVRQSVEIVSDPEQKYGKLKKILDKSMDGRRVLVFCETKRGCDDLTRRLRQDGFPALGLHGDKPQEERDWVLKEFKTAGSNALLPSSAGSKFPSSASPVSTGHPILVATDVAARGLDVKDVRLVVNFDPPRSAADYVHRVGRSGRAGAAGAAVTLMAAPADARFANKLLMLLEESGEEVPTALREMAEATQGFSLPTASALD
uniref:RNA helicase n=1 Tax=Polytomella parva TaxID=51329 RepID=A0A7S0VGK3_9CHLO|mmetsp:Transcript_32726/g.59312  ORF Transcript_32726/g.59312 Transcript_32726/m.59312 type:complete len:525 (+) Transcript_32726:140-1714(+)